jgi:chitinase
MVVSGGGPVNDDEGPTVTLTSPSNGATVGGTVTLAANASDNVGVASVAFFVDGTQIGSDTAAPFSVSWNSAAATNGSHTIVARAFDAAGNQGNSTIVVTVINAASDTTPPTISILAPTSGSNVNNTVTVLASANDDFRVAKVELYVDGALKATATNAPFTTKWNARKAPRGTHTLQLRATDSSGNTGWSSAVTVNR